jgi:hypothetical protein
MMSRNGYSVIQESGVRKAAVFNGHSGVIETCFLIQGGQLRQNIETRLAVLEKQFRRGDIVLVMAGGERQILRTPRGKDTLDIINEALNNPDGATAQMIRRCCYAEEPGGSKLVELAQALLGSPTENVLIGAN